MSDKNIFDVLEKEIEVDIAEERKKNLKSIIRAYKKQKSILEEQLREVINNLDSVRNNPEKYWDYTEGSRLR